VRVMGRRGLRHGLFLGHNWSRWEQYVKQWTETPLGLLYPAEVRGKAVKCSALYQKRTCSRCGRMQDEPVTGQ